MTRSEERRALVHRQLRAETKHQLAVNGPLPAGAIAVTFLGISVNVAFAQDPDWALGVIFGAAALLIGLLAGTWVATANKRAIEAADAVQNLFEFDERAAQNAAPPTSEAEQD